MKNIYLRNKQKIRKPQQVNKYSINRFSPWVEQEVKHENASPVPSHRKKIISSFVSKIIGFKKDRENKQVNQFSERKKEENIRMSTEKVFDRSQSKKCKTEGDFKKIKPLLRESMRTGKDFTKEFQFYCQQTKKKISIIDLNTTTKYFEEWEKTYINKEKEGIWNKLNYMSGIEDKCRFTVHKFLKNKPSKSFKKKKRNSLSLSYHK